MWNKLLHILSSDSQSQTGSDSNILINIRMKTPIWPNDTLKVRKGTGETLAYPPKTEPEQKKGRGTASAIKTVNTLLSFIRQNENVNETLGKPVFSEAGISSLCCKRWGSGSGCCQPEQGCACPIPVPRPSVPSQGMLCAPSPHPGTEPHLPRPCVLSQGCWAAFELSELSFKGKSKKTMCEYKGWETQ